MSELRKLRAQLTSLKNTEKRINQGRTINWRYWAFLQNITPLQAAKLANHVDPSIKNLPLSLSQSVSELEQLLANKQDKWSLIELVKFVGNNAPFMMQRAAKKQQLRVRKPQQPTNSGWKEIAWEIGKKWLTEQEALGKTPGVIAISKHVEKELKTADIRGKRGDYLSATTIQREALKGITGRARNGKKITK